MTAPALMLAALFAIQPPGSFHKGEAVARDGERWLALTVHAEAASLQPTRTRVSRVHDPLLDPAGEATGTDVQATEAPGALMLLRGEGLRAGPVVQARRSQREDPSSSMEPLSLGGKTYRWGLQCDLPRADGSNVCALVLEHGAVRQRLQAFDARTDDRGATGLGDEAHPRLLFAGDLDRDGRLDLIVDLSDHYNVSRPTLFLSSGPTPGTLVRAVASYRSVGC